MLDMLHFVQINHIFVCTLCFYVDLYLGHAFNIKYSYI